MLKDPNPYYKTGRHNKLNQQHTKARYHLRSGMARVALEAKVTGKPAEDSVGRPLLYANELAERHGAGQLERWANGNKTVAVIGGMDFCESCHRVPEYCKCR